MSSKDVLREKALAAWRFQPCVTEKEKEGNVNWNAQASQRDMEFVVRALQIALDCAPPDDNIFTTIDRNEKNLKITSEGERISQQKISEEKPPSRKRPRAGRSDKSPITFVAADRNDFRSIVQHRTGHSVLKPQPKRPCMAAAPSFASLPPIPPQALKSPSFSYNAESFSANSEDFSHNILFQTPQNCDPIVAGDDIFLELNDVAASAGWLNFSQYR